MSALRIVDFDGTLRDPIIEERDFTSVSIQTLARTTGLARHRVQAIASDVRRKMRTHPECYDWEFDGNIVSSLVGDPYLRIIAIAHAVAEATGGSCNGHELARLCLETCYPAASPFRTDAAALITSTDSIVHVVTNGTVEKVRPQLDALLRTLGSGGRTTVSSDLRGSAKKHVVDRDFTDLPESVPLPGRSRPLLLRRPNYFRILNELRERAGVGWREVEAIGDNLELDLSVPFAMGARIVLVANKHTPAWEVAFVQRYARGLVVTTLEEINNAARR